MSEHRRYKITDHRFGQLALTLREKAGLTQLEVADALHVSRRTIQHWESGSAFPAGGHLKSLIALFLTCKAFSLEHERDEARAFWTQADECAARRKSLFDDSWFDSLLHQHHHAPVALDSPTPLARVEEEPPPSLLKRADWGEAPDVTVFHGRESELATLAQWVLHERCRVLAVLGIGGLGKTTLCLHFAQVMADTFDFVIWRSLRNAPPLNELLVDCFQTLSEPLPSGAIQNVDRGITRLIELLRQHRCLIVLDNVETLLQSGALESQYRAGYEAYRQFFQRIAETSHQSCMLLTGREMLSELEPFEGTHAPVRALKLDGLPRAVSQALLQDKELFGTAGTWEVFVQQYSGNPLALKIAAATVRKLFGGDLAAYLREAPVTLHTLNQLLQDQFERLTPAERDVLIWLAIERDPVSLEVLSSNQHGVVPRKVLLTALQSLWRRSLIERSEHGAVFTLQSVVMEYVSERLVTHIVDDMIHGNVGALASYALMKSESADYVRNSQTRMLVEPVLNGLLAHFGDRQRVAVRVRELVQQVRALPEADQGYAGGNLINLLVDLQGNLRGWDFSHLVLRQGYLQGVDVQEANFAASDIRDTRFTEPLESIISMKLSPDGQYLAVGSFSGQVRLWHLPDCTPVWSVKGHTRMAWALAFNADRTLLASGGYRGRVKLWDVATGQHLRTMKGHDQWVRTVAFHPDGHMLVSAGNDGTIRVWDVETGTCLRVLTGHAGRIWSLAFTPDGTLLVSGGGDGTTRLWDAHTGANLGVLSRHATGVLSVAVHCDSVLVASGSEDGQITLYDISTRRRLTTLQRRGSGAASIAFNPEGTLLASGSDVGMVELWEIGSEATPRYAGSLQGHRWLVSIVSFAPRGLLASAAYGGNVKLWDVTSGKGLRTIQGYSQIISALAFHPDGSLLAQGDDNGTVRVWDMQSGQCLATVHGHTGPVWTIVWSPDGQTFATGGDGGTVNLWHARSGRHLHSFADHPVVIWALAFSPDGTMLATGGAAGEIKVWDVNRRHAAPLAILNADWVWSLTFDPSGHTLASGHANGDTKLWDIETHRCLATLQHEDGPIEALHYEDAGVTLISCSDSSLTWWDITTRSSVRVASQPDRCNWIKAAAFSADSAYLATDSDDQTVQLWRIDAGDAPTPCAPLVGHAGHIWAVALSTDHSKVASSDDAGTTIVWDTESGAVLHQLSPDRPYERMNILGIKGVTEPQRAALKALGAVEGVVRG